MTFSFKKIAVSGFVSLSLLTGSAWAADKKKKTVDTNRETIAKPLSEKEKAKREKKLRDELMGPYRKWLNEDVTYIITDEERAFLLAD